MGADAYDEAFTEFDCPSCGAPVDSGSIIMVKPSVPSRVEDLDALAERLRASTPPPDCPACGEPARLTRLWFHSFHPTARRDYVLRWSAERGLERLWWTPGHEEPAVLDAAQGEALLLAETARALSLTEDQDVLIHELERALARWPNELALLQLLPALIEQGPDGLEAAYRMIDRGLERVRSPIALLWRVELMTHAVGVGLEELDVLDGAEALVARALALPGGDVEQAHVLRGNIHRLRGDQPAARAAYEEVLQRFPTSAQAHYNLGLIYLEQSGGSDPETAAGAAETALWHFEQGQAADPDDPDFDVGRARALLALGRTDEARLAAAAAREAGSDHPELKRVERAIDLQAWADESDSVRKAREALEARSNGAATATRSKPAAKKGAVKKKPAAAKKKAPAKKKPAAKQRPAPAKKKKAGAKKKVRR